MKGCSELNGVSAPKLSNLTVSMSMFPKLKVLHVSKIKVAHVFKIEVVDIGAKI